MKKIFKIAFILSIALMLYSCSSGSIANTDDRTIINNKFEEVLTAIQTEDKKMLISLFSEETRENVENLEQAAEELFKYFNGDVEEYDDRGTLLTDDSKDYGKVSKEIDGTFDVKTTECEYRFTIKYISIDELNANNIGIQSLYIIKADDDTNKINAYWGDHKYTSGINIGIKNQLS